MENLPSDLAGKEQKVYLVDWLTYCYSAENKKMGLDRFIAKCLGIEGSIDLLESPNDTDYKIEADADKLDKYDMETIDEIIKYKGIEHYKLRTIMSYLAQKGYIPFGIYVIRISW